MSNSIQRGDLYPINLGFYAETEIYNYTTGAWEEYLSLSDIQWTTLGMKTMKTLLMFSFFTIPCPQAA